MKAYCINLDRRPDRLDFMTSQLGRQGVPFTRVAAVDGQDATVASAALACPPSAAGLRISASAYACFQSHRAVWHRITDGGDRHGIVLEDDVMLADGFAQCLSDGWVPTDADLVRLETVGARVYLDAGSGTAAGPRQLHRMRSYHAGTGGYVVSAIAAARLIDATAAICDPVDQTLFNPQLPLFGMLTTYQMLPAPVIQGDRNLGAMASPAPWAASSITDRFAGERASHRRAPERFAVRLRRRIDAEVRGAVTGLRYRTIPHG